MTRPGRPGRRRGPPLAALLATLVSALAVSAAGQTIDRSRGADPRVDYAALARLGPWDDRNYRLTRQDLTLLAPDEEAQVAPIPAFFRVELRRRMPGLRRRGAGQYPRAAVNVFLLRHGGYLVDGALHRQVRFEDGRYVVVASPPAPEREPPEPLALFDGEVRVTMPNPAAESSVKVHPTDPSRVVAGTVGPGGGQRMHYSTDGGATWTQVLLPEGLTCCDPAVDWSHDGAFAHAATLSSSFDVWTYRSDDGGVTWTGLESVTPGDPRREVTNAGVSDKEYLHVDKHPGSPFLDHVYLTWHDNNVMKFARSIDDGHTWQTRGFPLDPRGIGSDIVTDENGQVVYAWPTLEGETRSRIVVKRSTDGGVTFAPGVVTVAPLADEYDFAIPAMDSRRAFVYVAADADLTDGPFAGSLYLAWTDNLGPEQPDPEDNHARIRVARSRDGGATWATATPHETADQLAVDRFHPWLAVAPDGAVHVVFYDTRLDATRIGVDLFHTVSTDGGATFAPPSRLTTVTSPEISTLLEWGDYNGLDAVLTQLIALYTDNRNETGGGGNSSDVYAIGRPLAAPVFADGFESGDTGAWDETTF